MLLEKSSDIWFIHLDPFGMEMIQASGHEWGERRFGRNGSTHGVQHVGGLVIRVVVRSPANLDVRNGCRKKGFQVLDVFNGALENRQLVQVVLVHTGWNKVLQLQDLVVDPFTPPPFDRRM